MTQFYSIAHDPVNNLSTGGAQDTGLHQQPAGGGVNWTTVSKGDGNVVAISVTQVN